MFENIHFTRSETTMPLSSRQILGIYDRNTYEEDNISHAEFLISGKLDAFLRPPVTDYAREHLSYMQAFNIFYYNKGSFTRRSDYHSFLVLYTLNGKGKLEYGGKTYELNPGDGAFINCMKPHYYEALEEWDVCVLHVLGGQCEHLCDEYENVGTVQFHEAERGRFTRNLEELIGIYDSPSLQRDLRADHAINGLLLYLLMQNYNLNISNGTIPQSIQKAMKYMEDHFAEPISLDDLAELTSTNKYHFSKEFKHYTSFSPHNYLIQLRIDQARLLLKNTDLPAVKIAHEVGIHDINNFNYLFKKRTGKTPIQYRKEPVFLS